MVPVTTAACSPVRDCWLRAWDRAKADQLIPFHNADGTWTVKTYTVTITGPGWSNLNCNCAAGRNHRICKHAAVVAKAIACGVRPVRGTAKREPAMLSRNPATLTPTMAAQYAPTAQTLIAGVAPSLADLYV